MKKIWVDADACPGPVKEVIIRAALRLRVPTVFVANKRIGLPDSVYLSTVRVGQDVDEADRYIAANVDTGDFAITQDIPLASDLVPRGVRVIDTHGNLLDEDNIRERLSVRDFMQDLRDAGGVTPGPKPFGPKDKQRFADTFDRELTRWLR